MPSKRLTYRLLSAISEFKEGEKDMPDGVSEKLDALSESLHGHVTATKSSDGETDESSFENAGKKAAEKFRGEKDQKDD